MTRRITIVAALALLLGALPLRAQGPGGPGGQRMGGPGRGGPGGPGGPMGMLPGLNQMDLTDAQREQIRAVMEQERQDDPGERMRQGEEALHAAVLAQDAQGTEAAKALVNAARMAELEHRVAVMQKVVQILTPSQRQQLAQLPAGGRGRGRAPGGV